MNTFEVQHRKEIRKQSSPYETCRFQKTSFTFEDAKREVEEVIKHHMDEELTPEQCRIVEHLFVETGKHTYAYHPVPEWMEVEDNG